VGFKESEASVGLPGVKLVQRVLGGLIGAVDQIYGDLAATKDYGNVEVKNDTKSEHTNNIAVEYMGNLGQDSGITTTMSDHWAHLVRIDGRCDLWLFATTELRAKLQLYNCLDNGVSNEGAVCHLIPKHLAKEWVKVTWENLQ